MIMAEEKTVQLRVGDARQRDVGRGIARIDQRTVQKLGVCVGDVIEIVGKRTTSAIVWPAYNEDQNRDIIRLDEFIRRNAGVALNDYVIVRPVRTADATNVTLAPIDIRLNIDQDFTNWVKRCLEGKPLVKEDIIPIQMLEVRVMLKVIETEPQGVVLVKSDTNVIILEELPEVSTVKKELEMERKKLGRFAWLKAMERKCAADYTKFSIPECNIERDREEEVLKDAECLIKDREKPITIFVDLFEKRGKIASFQWIRVNTDGSIEYIYSNNILKVCPICGEPTVHYHGREFCYRCYRYVY